MISWFNGVLVYPYILAVSTSLTSHLPPIQLNLIISEESSCGIDRVVSGANPRLRQLEVTLGRGRRARPGISRPGVCAGRYEQTVRPLCHARKENAASVHRYTMSRQSGRRVGDCVRVHYVQTVRTP
jgi:hypothetical protein